MTISKIIFTTVLFINLLLTATYSHADSTISLNSNQGNAILSIKNDFISLKPADPEDVIQLEDFSANEALFHTPTQTLYIIDHEQAAISTLTKTYIDQLSNTLNAANDILNAIPDDQRDTLSGLMNGLGINVPEPQSSNSLTTLEATSIQEFRGITCQESNLVAEDKVHGQICITQGNSTSLSNNDYENLVILQSFLLNIAKQAAPFAQQYELSIPNLDGIEVDGLLVNSNIQSRIQVNNQPQAVNSHFVVTGINNETIDEISLPSNYQSKPLSIPQN